MQLLGVIPWREESLCCIKKNPRTEINRSEDALFIHLIQQTPSHGGYVFNIQAGLLTLGSSYRPRLPICLNRQWHVAAFVPITAAGPFPICTGFPFKRWKGTRIFVNHIAYLHFMSQGFLQRNRYSKLSSNHGLRCSLLTGRIGVSLSRSIWGLYPRNLQLRKWWFYRCNQAKILRWFDMF